MTFAWLVVVPKSVTARNTARKDLMRTPSLPLRTFVTRPPCGWPGRGPLGIDGAEVYGWRGRPETQEVKNADGTAMEGPARWGSAPQEFQRRVAALAGSGGLGGEFAFPASNDHARDTITQNCHCSAAHVHELIDREEKK